MSEIIRSYIDFNTKRLLENDKLNEFDFSSILSGGMDALGDTAKGKVTEYLLSYLGIGPESLFGIILVESAEQISMSEWMSLFTKGEIPHDMSKKMAAATMEVLTDRGVSFVADRLGIAKKSNKTAQDTKSGGLMGMFSLFGGEGSGQDGLLYRMLSEMLQNQASKGELAKTLEDFYATMFNQIAKLIK